jgi:hypothetical protein
VSEEALRMEKADITQLIGMLIVTTVQWGNAYLSQRSRIKQFRIVNVPYMIALLCGNPRGDSTIDVRYSVGQFLALLTAIVSIIVVCLQVDFQERIQILALVYFGGLFIWAALILLNHWN